ncbi:hypothetical protein DYE50_07315 [Treponema ruminis]|uniref:Uncharacterized protein n=1 Tax=Treponema ruminis TaxID=744515 RepID=A0A7W8G8C8_9SPIR|nr:hypothetical protein [Treponema ruminis]MBB5225686.1 hypothetical protein [Treponema ruminis]QSI02375.1 hypothetical protein DYE50_07315 [Treponema ruminis]
MKKIIFTLAALSFAAFSFADDFDFGGDSGDDFGGSSFEESSAPAVTVSGEVGAETRAWLGTTNKDTGKFDTKNYKGAYDLSKTQMDAGAYANLELNYEGDYTGANLKLKLDSTSLTEHHEDVIDELYASGSFKEGKFQLKAGKMKEVWGKGDKVHVLDNFNANDYSDFIFPDYIDRRIGEVMFKATANLSWDYNLKLEGIFTPWMTADRFASEGFLVPAAQKKLTNEVTKLVKTQAASQLEGYIGLAGTGTTDDPYKIKLNSDGLITGLMGLSSFSADSLYEDNIKTIKYGQAGLRMTGTLGGIDWGASYYYGHYKQPSAKLLGATSMTYYANAAQKYADGATKAKNAAEQYANAAKQYATAGDTVNAQAAQAKALEYQAQAEQAAATAQTLGALAKASLAKDPSELISLNYDQLQVFGLEAAFVLWKLNTRWEVAYNLTEDTAGDNPWIKNNSVSWLVGFDIDLPIHNLNLNVQETGKYILKNDKIKDGGIDIDGVGRVGWETLGNLDTDYNSDDKYINNKIIALISDKWLNEKLTTEVQGIYCIEDKGYMVAPKIEYNVSEGLTFGLRGVYLHCDNENGEFYNFTADTENNDKAFLQLTAKYQF